jgi:hypothetical protein
MKQIPGGNGGYVATQRIAKRYYHVNHKNAALNRIVRPVISGSLAFGLRKNPKSKLVGNIILC